MSSSEQTLGPVQVFRASWRSTAAVLTVFFGLITGVLVYFMTRPAHTGVPLLLGVGAAVCGGLTWLLGRRVFSRRPALQLSPQGIRSFANRGELIAWRHIVDVRQLTVQNQVQLLLTLAPDAGVKTVFGRNCSQFGIPLVFFPRKDQQAVIDATLDAYARHGGEQFVQALAAMQAEVMEVNAFESRLQAMTPVTWGLYLVVAINVGVWLAMVASGVGAMKPQSQALLAWGANSAASVTEDREYWRLLTATFLHAGLMHLAFNMLGLWGAGRQLSRMYGNAQFLLIYFASALAGSALSLHFSAQQSVSVGASGAVFGVLGALVVAVYRHRGRLPKSTGKNLLTSQVVFLVYALGQGFASQGVDNAAHAGGLVCGALLALLLVDRFGKDDAVEFSPGAVAPVRRAALLPASAGALLAGAAVAALVATTPVPTVHHRQLFALQSGLQAQLPVMKTNEAAFQADTNAYRAGTLSEAGFIDAIESRHLPAYAAVEAALAPLDMPASDRLGGSLRDLRQSNALMVELMRLQVGVSRAPETRAAANARIEAIGAELSAINARFAEGAKKPASAPSAS